MKEFDRIKKSIIKLKKTFNSEKDRQIIVDLNDVASALMDIKEVYEIKEKRGNTNDFTFKIQ